MDDRNDFENSYHYFIVAAEVLAADPEEQCRRLGDFNVAFETKFDFSAGLYLKNYRSCRLSSHQYGLIVELVEALECIPPEVVSFTKNKSVSLEKMKHPSWQPLRSKASELLDAFSLITEENRRYFATPK